MVDPFVNCECSGVHGVGAREVCCDCDAEEGAVLIRCL